MVKLIQKTKDHNISLNNITLQLQLRKQNVNKNSWKDKIPLLNTNLPSVVIPSDGIGQETQKSVIVSCNHFSNPPNYFIC